MKLSFLDLFKRRRGRYGARPITPTTLMVDALKAYADEAESWTAWARLPFSLSWWAVVWLYWCLVFCTIKRIQWALHITTYVGRFNNPEPILCPGCLWAGPHSACIHDYTGEDSDAVDLCPRCETEVL